MKKQLLLLIFATSAFFANAQNLITNGDFETDVTTYTVAESTTRVLKRVAGIYDPVNSVNNATSNPTAPAATIDAGQWVKRAPDDVLAKGIILSTGAYAGTSCLNLKIGANSAFTGYNNSLALLALQKLNASLSNSKRYLVTFWAKQDASTNNRCVGVNVVLGDNVVKSTTAPLTVGAMLTGGTTWTQYSVVLDIPKYIALNPTADFSPANTATLGFAITTTYVTTGTKPTAAAGVLLDDVSMTEFSPTVAYVKPTAIGTGDGSSWANATANIQDAINSVTYGEVRVAAGTYTPSATITLKDGVNLIGAYAADGSGIRDLWNNKTILDGAGDKQIIMNSNTANPFKYTTKVDGFILQNGNSTYGSAASLSLGAVLENCIIRNNTGGAVVGAAVYFKRNAAVHSSNYSTNYQATGSLINCLVINNTSAGGAGGVYGESNSLFGVVNCVIANNKCTEATTGTGGVYIGGSAQWSHLQNCILYNNSGASTNYNNLRNNTLANPVALNVVLNNWFDNNSSINTTGVGNFNLHATNSTNNKFNNQITTPDFEQPTTFQGATTDPAQVTALEESNWRLKSTSSLIGLGNSTQNIRTPYENINAILVVTTGGRPYSDITTDIMGTTRILNTTVDMGAYEYNPVVVTAANGANGTAAGGITVSKGTSVALTSTPASGYRLADWTNGATVVSTSPTYTFIPTANSTIQANFASNTVSVGAATNASSLVNCENCDISVANGGTLTINETKTVNSITVAQGGKLSIPDNTKTLTGTVVLESNTNGTATLVDAYNTPTLTATVKQHVTEGRNWYMSAPVSNALFSQITGGDSVVAFNEALKKWEKITADNLIAGKGYIRAAVAGRGTTATVDFNGLTNSGNVAITVSRTESGSSRGFNLVGNPYPSYLKWNGENSFLEDATNDSISTSFWYRTKNVDGEYIFTTYNGTSHDIVGGTTANTLLNELIPPMQAFWIRVNANATLSTHNVGLTFKNNMRFHGAGDNNKFKAPKVAERSRLRLHLANGSKSDEALIYFDAAAANTFDNYDSPKMMNNSTTLPDLYSTVGTERLAINGLNQFADNMELPLGFTLKSAATGLKLKVSELSNFAIGTKVYLLDKERNTQTELLPATEYTFNTTASNTNNESRFNILFRSASVVNGMQQANNTLSVNIFRNAANQITINSNTAELGMVLISNSLGQKMLSTPTTGLSTVINKSLSSGVYFVTVVVAGNRTTQKVIID